MSLMRSEKSCHCITWALVTVHGRGAAHLIEVSRPAAMDEVTVHVEMRSQDFSDRMSDMQALKDRIDREIQSITGIRMNISLDMPKTIERRRARPNAWSIVAAKNTKYER